MSSQGASKNSRQSSRDNKLSNDIIASLQSQFKRTRPINPDSFKKFENMMTEKKAANMFYNAYQRKKSNKTQYTQELASLNIAKPDNSRSSRPSSAARPSRPKTPEEKTIENLNSRPSRPKTPKEKTIENLNSRPSRPPSAAIPGGSSQNRVLTAKKRLHTPSRHRLYNLKKKKTSYYIKQ
jgi:hypothetical protein